MDIYRFINSKDIRKHLKDMDYEFNALEAAWLVYQCGNAPLDEKHNAWTWIIEHMADMEVPDRGNCIYRSSLHDTLHDYMAMDDDLIARFKAPGDDAFTIDSYYAGSKASLPSYGYGKDVYYSYEECINRIKEEQLKEEEYEDFTRQCHEYIGANSWLGSCYIAERHFKDKDEKIEVIYGPGCAIRHVRYDTPGYCGKYDDLSLEFFEGLWFDFPTPFQKGDIVHMVYDDPDGEWAYRFCHGGMVLTGLLPWKLDEKRKRSYIEGRNGDTSDMTIYGMFISEEGVIYNECTYNYMDLEYYNGPYEGMRRILKPLSNFVKGEIDIELFLFAYRTFILEEKLEEVKRGYHWFTDESLELAGLMEDKTCSDAEAN